MKFTLFFFQLQIHYNDKILSKIHTWIKLLVVSWEKNPQCSLMKNYGILHLYIFFYNLLRHSLQSNDSFNYQWGFAPVSKCLAFILLKDHDMRKSSLTLGSTFLTRIPRDLFVLCRYSRNPVPDEAEQPQSITKSLCLSSVSIEQISLGKNFKFCHICP